MEYLKMLNFTNGYNNQTHRIAWLDMIKAYAIFLVFWGHKINNIYMESIIYSFHIPLFFWVSGYVFDRNRYKDFNNFLIKKIKTLLVPYFIFALFSYMFWYFAVRSLSVRGQALTQDPLLPFWGIFYGVGVEPWRNPLDVALWFLPCLFVTEIFYWIINSCSNLKIRAVIVALFGLCGYFTANWLSFRLPWSIDVALIAVVFYYLGEITRTINSRLHNNRIGWRIVFIFLFFLFCLLLSKANGKADMNYNHYGNFPLFLIAAFSGIYFSYLLFSTIPISRIISYAGQNTIILVGLGGVSSFFINGVYYLVMGTIFSGEKDSIIEPLIYSCLEILLLLPVIYLINRYTPSIIGRNRKIKSNL